MNFLLFIYVYIYIESFLDTKFLYIQYCNTYFEVCILYDINENKEKGGENMQEDRSCGCGCNNGPVGGLFGDNCSVLFFILIFLLLFTDFGCGCGLLGGTNNGCGCGRNV
jgi:hypothetical protein